MKSCPDHMSSTSDQRLPCFCLHALAVPQVLLLASYWMPDQACSKEAAHMVFLLQLA